MIKIYQIDVMKALKQMPDESVDMQITSPPYWSLRDYGEGVEVIWDGDEDCEHDWNEIIKAAPGGRPKKETTIGRWKDAMDMSYGLEGRPQKSNSCSKCGAWKGQLGLEPDFNLYIKHLADIFNEVKRVLKKDGTCWVNLGDTYCGSGAFKPEYKCDNSLEKKKIQGGHYPNPELKPKWNKLNYQDKCLICIPERFMIEMISRGWILRNKIIWHKPNHMPTSVKDRFANSWEYLFFFSKSKEYYFDLDAVREAHKWADKDKRSELIRVQHKSGKSKLPEFQGGFDGVGYNPKGKNPDDVVDFWNITTHGYPEAHFAVFPEALVKRPIKTTRKNAVILDIFVGSGTTLKVARDLHRDSIGIEIKKEYCDLIKKRLFKGNQPLFEDFEVIK